MASKQGSKRPVSRGSGSYKGKNKKSIKNTEQENALLHEVILILLFAAAIILFLCNFGVIGTVGDAISGVLFGLFGYLAYGFSILAFLAFAFWSANAGSPSAIRKIVAGCILFLMIGIIFEMIWGNALVMEKYNLVKMYQFCSTNEKGGGVIAGSIVYALHHFVDTLGTVLIVVISSIISLVLLTERSLVDSMKNGGRRVAALSKDDRIRLRSSDMEEERLHKEEIRAKRVEQKRLRAEEKENVKILRMDKKVTGVMANTSITQITDKKDRDDIHEITLNDIEDNKDMNWNADLSLEESAINKIRIRGMSQTEEVSDDHNKDEWPEMSEIEGRAKKPSAKLSAEQSKKVGNGQIVEDIRNTEKKLPRKYIFPPLSRLKKGKSGGGDSARELKETAFRLQQTLQTFGVKVTITDISQGPAVTRYELQPEQGVKVSKIVGLADDIKLNLAATDIRIEAPIPGKAAIGIEVPNKENTTVALRDLFESKEFKEFPSNLTFSVGKDIAGKVVVADIAKMPHMLIAGATGSGKSVCINTLIMSILYKAHPEDVKLIMIDPKVVELSVYNGIPHLLIPVVTDPKKAAAALHWGVSEMEDRYKKFAELNVRDLKGYNHKAESLQQKGGENPPAKLPQIVIIVDELADLMMVAPGEVEESICRLAQLARAAGIHLIIATQRPSVDVITGLIKANMPSRVAFSVSSGVDSRTILDMNGAEKLLGKGDMLFYPQGYAKPIRVQGAFVSDKEVSDVVDFLKNQAIGNVYAEDVEEKIKKMGSTGAAGSIGGDSANPRDEYFVDAGRFIIDKDKASIGMFQRVFKIGFNRAARIMDQLYECGVVGEEEGTKPRKVLMSMEQFEQLLEEL